MKRTTLVNLICSMIAAVVVIIAVMLTMVFTGVFGVEQGNLVIRSSNATAVYDGTALTNSEWTISSGELREGHTITVNVTGRQTNVGISENYLSAVIRDKNGADVSSDYNITYETGVLNVKPRDICIIADSAMKKYDGEPLVADSYTLQSKRDLVSTDVLTVTVEGSQTEIGKSDNVISSVLIENQLGENVTRNYNIIEKTGKLIVYSEDTIVIKTDDDAKEYDGLALENSNWSLVSGELQSDHHIAVDVTGSRVSVGEAENTFTVQILDGDDNDVTGQYEILSVPGTLTVIPRELTIRSNDATKVWDGKPLTESGYTVSPAYFSNLIVVEELIMTGSQTDVGSSDNTMEEHCVIYSNAEKDITSNFKIIYEFGKLEVTAAPPVTQPVVFESSSASKNYDGAVLTSPHCELKSGSLLEGHRAVAKTISSIINVGFCDNKFELTIYDENNNDVTDIYRITKEFGTLQVFPLEVVVKSADAQKVYDGEPLTCNEYELFPAHIGNKFNFSVEIIGSRVEPGEGTNTISACRVYNEWQDEITRNFVFKKIEGILTVVEKEEELKKELTYQSGSATKPYDGTPLSNDVCDLVLGELPEGYTQEIEINTSITNVGTVDNEFKVTIYDVDGNDVTDKEFLITYKYGILKVTRRNIVVTANSDSKVYDGTPLTNDGYTLSNADDSDKSSPLVGEDTIKVTVIGTITEVGSEPNIVESAIVYDKDGNVSDNYIVIKYGGELTIIEKSEGGGSGEGEGGGSGEGEGGGSGEGEGGGSGEGEGGGSGEGEGGGSGEGEGGGGGLGGDGDMTGKDHSSDDVVMFTVKANGHEAENIYLKMESFGNFNSAENKWELAPKYTEQTFDGYTANYLASLCHTTTGLSATTLTIVPVAGGYLLPYYTISDNSGIKLTDDAVVLRNHTEQYDVSYFAYQPEAALDTDSYGEYEKAYRKFAYENYAGKDNIDPATYEYFADYARSGIDMSQFKSGDTVLVSKVQQFIMRSAKYNLDYPESLDTSETPIIEFFTVKEGLCRHYAAAATMLFRYLGVPARYTTGFYVGGIGEDATVNVYGKQAHAWVEIYYPEYGWVNIEVTGSADGHLEPINAEIKPKTVREKYTDGATLSVGEIGGITGFDTYLDKGYKCEYELSVRNVSSGILTDPGAASSYISYFLIKNPDGKVIYEMRNGNVITADTDNYKFGLKFKDGYMQLYRDVIKISSDSKNKTYDGMPLYSEVGDFRYSGTLAEGHKIEFTPMAPIVDAMTIKNSCTVLIKDKANSNQKVNDEYWITYSYGDLTINRCTIVVQAGSAEKTWNQSDMTPLECNSLSYDESKIAKTDVVYDEDWEVGPAAPVYIGSGTNYVKKFIIRRKGVYGADGKELDVSSNYHIILLDGMLTVREPEEQNQ